MASFGGILLTSLVFCVNCTKTYFGNLWTSLFGPVLSEPGFLSCTLVANKRFMADVFGQQPLDSILGFMISLEAANVIACVSRHFLQVLREESTWSDVAVDMRFISLEDSVLATLPFRRCRFIRVRGAPYRHATRFSVPVYTSWDFGPALYGFAEGMPIPFLRHLAWPRHWSNHDYEARLARQPLWGWSAVIQMSLRLLHKITSVHFGLFTSRSTHRFLSYIAAGQRLFGLPGSYLGVALALDWGNGCDNSHVVVRWDYTLWRCNWNVVTSCVRKGHTVLKNGTLALALQLTRDDVTLHVEGEQFSSRLLFASAPALVREVVAHRLLYPALVLEAKPCDRAELDLQMAVVKTVDIPYYDGDARGQFGSEVQLRI